MATTQEYRTLENVHAVMEDVKRYVLDRGGNQSASLYILAEQMQVAAEEATKLLEQER